VPRQSSKVSGIFSRYGSKAVEAFNKHKGDETEYGNFGDLPPGIDGGIAQLVDCRVLEIKEGKQNAGELMFFARGIVVEPEEVEDPRTGLVVRIKNRNTTLSEPLFHTAGRARETFEDHMAYVLNHLRKLGLSTEDIAATDEEFNSQLATLKESAPFFRFGTWLGPKSEQYPNPRVNHRWEGTLGLEDYTPPDEGSPVEDETGSGSPSGKGNGSVIRPYPAGPTSTPSNPPGRPAAPSPTKTRPTVRGESQNSPAGQPGGKPVSPSARPAARPATPPAGRPSGKPVAQPVVPPSAEPTLEPSSLRSSGHEAYADEFGDLDSLAEKADAEDKESQKTLEAMATEAGVPKDAVKKARSWADVAALIAAAGQPGDEDEEEEESGDENESTEDTEEASPDDSDDEEEDGWDGPVVGDMYSYRIGKRLADVEVLEVNAVKQTVTVKNYSELKGPPIKGVKWAQLIRKPPTE
jgi:hypothetical protein